MTSLFGVIWLVVAGVLMLAIGAFMAWGMATRTDSCVGIECSLRPLFLIVGLVGVAFGAAYAGAGVGVWRGRPRARLAGVALALPGFLLTLFFFGMFLPVALRWNMSDAGYVGVPAWPMILTLGANGVAIVGLLAWERSPS